MSEPQSKLAQLVSAWNGGDRIGALRIAAKFPRLDGDKEAITRAWAAHANPEFYRGIGKDPAQLIEAGIDAMQRRYDLD